MSSKQDTAAASSPDIAATLTGRRVFYYFLAFFVFIALVNVVFIYLAGSSNPGTVTEKAYEKGLAYNRVVDAAQAQQRLGWTHTLVVRIEADKAYRVALRMKDSAGERLTGGSALIRFYRPVESGIDFDVALKEERPGAYLALKQFPQKGAWDAYIAVRRGENVYRARERIIIR